MIVVEEIGNILESHAQTLVVPVNTVGVMGKGLAKAFADRHPSLLPAYQKACKLEVFKREGLFLHTTRDGQKLLCFPTKHHWRRPSKLIWIDQGLHLLAQHVDAYGITSLAVPALGCGEGRLAWEDVRALIHRYLGQIDTPVAVFPPYR